MTRTCLLTVLALLVTVTVSPSPAVAESPSLGVIPLQLTDTETSYLGVRLLSICARCRPMQDARLPVTNDGSNVAHWGSSIPLRILDALATSSFIEARVMPLAFNLAGSHAWIDAYGGFTYTVRLNPAAIQPQSLLYFATDGRGAPTSFAGTLYVAAVLTMTDLATGSVDEQPLNLALNIGGKWMDEPAATQLDSTLSSILPFTERGTVGQPAERYTCATETHPLGHYCLQVSSDLLASLGGVEH